ncbi:halovibrin HvnA [Pseudomonas prosekii]|uniref:Halovibrin HvnA n=1 Tax=Pseudomonas prosekii TaxID=1148509 RepID=A0A3L8CTS3_9PSED|nr:halovibrin HvnA [Pseudomonas prosekii]RLU11194.1 halovibrin HvnA [Pseudomonas prosekii]RLU14514.1 halovibrin HvnA [Pseudomonas prosekii]
MKRSIALSMATLLSACQTSTTPKEAPLEAPQDTTVMSLNQASASDAGVRVATALTQRYMDTRLNCGANSMPAFLCSGIILRSTVPAPGSQYFTWNPSPNSQKSGGVSFSYLRKDMNFKSLVFGQTSGFIFLPVLNQLPGTRKIEVLCTYPVDGAVLLRDKPGCGAHPYAPDLSRRCQTIGITTAEQWIANKKKNGWNSCSFDVRDSMNQLAADSFYQAIRAHNLGNYFAGAYDYSELILATWPQNIPKELPIEAFYYITTGLPGAQKDQRDFYAQTAGKVVPVIKLTLPATNTGNAVFSYNPADQVH